MRRSIGLLLAIIMMMSFLAGCTTKNDKGKEAKEVDLKEIHGKIKEEMGEDYYPDREMTLDEIKDITGIDKEDVEEYIAEAPMMTMNTDIFIGIKAREGKGDAIEEGLQKYRTYMMEESFQYPMNIAKVQAAKVVRHGDYVFFLILGKHNESMEDAESKEALEFAQNEVKKVEDIINTFFK
ncbi:DUF4358 domain-containing protein [Wansuia hejianensis]|uniref:DUF4358 domain-containing protein n=1 Tax=Wansuia hejianensis TaxID=2763667 RepID=A0A926IH46_9FIRM|nr:DUF4358 domain-containing protein [Wansuia hejianensis]MBC8590262.1 DUF4358 domain-containing protein [Wansuia hejianensis]